MRIVRRLLAVDHQIVVALTDAELVARNAGEWLEGRPGGPPAVRAMAIERIAKLVRDRVADCAAETSSRQQTVLHIFGLRHLILPGIITPLHTMAQLQRGDGDRSAEPPPN